MIKTLLYHRLPAETKHFTCNFILDDRCVHIEEDPKRLYAVRRETMQQGGTAVGVCKTCYEAWPAAYREHTETLYN